MAKSMSDADPTLKDVWRLLGIMNKRFDALERQIVDLREDTAKQFAEVRMEFGSVRGEMGGLRAEMRAGFGVLKESIEARDFRLDEPGRRITDLEMLRSQPPEAT
jgi:hypothetical protein